MAQLKSKSGETYDAKLTFKNVQKIQEKLDVDIFSLASDSDAGFFQGLYLNPMKAFVFAKDLLGLDDDAMEDIDVDDLYEFIEKLVIDFFPKKVRETIRDLFKAVKDQMGQSSKDSPSE